MGSMLKILIGLLIVLVLGSYIIDSRPVSNALETGQKTADPLVSGARTVKQEVKTLTSPVRIEGYKRAVLDGLNSMASKIQELTAEKVPLQPTQSKAKDSGTGL